MQKHHQAELTLADTRGLSAIASEYEYLITWKSGYTCQGWQKWLDACFVNEVELVDVEAY